MPSHACWAKQSLCYNQDALKILRELVRLDLANDNAIGVEFVNDEFYIRVKLNHIGHWSRRIEWPWAVIAGCLKPDDIVLDAGGGDGIFQHIISKRCQLAINLDYSIEQLKNAKSQGMVNLYRGDLRAIPCRDSTFDKVFSISVLEHMSDLDMKTAFTEMYRVLKPNGLLIGTVDITSSDQSTDLQSMNELLSKYVKIPNKPNDAIEFVFDKGLINVLCFVIEKI
jgi:SAM-dependent methyltransferase